MLVIAIEVIVVASLFTIGAELRRLWAQSSFKHSHRMTNKRIKI
jgi:hypothetical protein